MLKYLSFAAVQVLKIMNLFFKPLPLKDKVTIISRQADEPTLDITLLVDAFHQKGVCPVVLTKTLKKSVPGMVTYGIHLLQQMYHIATSKVIILDGYCILVSVLPKKGDQKVVQMWHALGAIKKFGWQSVDNPDGHGKAFSEIMNMHGNYDYVLAPSRTTGKFFAEAFRASENKLVYYGLPRIDFIRDIDNKKNAEIFAKYPNAAEKENVLYVPTFRKNAELNLEALVSGFDFSRFNLIIKKHFLDKGDYSWAIDAGAIVDTTFTSLEWLRICEKVVTDYSAIAFEAAVLDREVYIYQPDVSAYASNVGLNVDLKQEAIGQYVCRSESELFENLYAPYEKDAIREFRKKHIEVELEGCTERLCGFIIDLLRK